MITSFRGPHGFLSNFFPVMIEYDGVIYPSLEHAYQAAKTLDQTWRLRIHCTPSPGEAKRLGRKAPLRPAWFHIRVQVMERLVRQKFQDQELRAKLLDTGDEALIEGHQWADHFWGAVYENGRWRGENHLGKLLMQIRYEFQYPHHYPPTAPAADADDGQVACPVHGGLTCHEPGCAWNSDSE